MEVRILCYILRFCMSIPFSVTLAYCVKMANHPIKWFSDRVVAGSPVILVSVSSMTPKRLKCSDTKSMRTYTERDSENQRDSASMIRPK